MTKKTSLCVETPYTASYFLINLLDEPHFIMGIWICAMFELKKLLHFDLTHYYI